MDFEAEANNENQEQPLMAPEPQIVPQGTVARELHEYYPQLQHHELAKRAIVTSIKTEKNIKHSLPVVG